MFVCFPPECLRLGILGTSCPPPLPSLSNSLRTSVSVSPTSYLLGSLSGGPTALCPLSRLRQPLPVGLSTFPCLFYTPSLPVSTCVSVWPCLSQVSLSSAPISNSLLGVSLAPSTSLSGSVSPLTPDPQSPRSKPEYSEWLCLSRLSFRPHLSLCLGLPRPSLRAPPSPTPSRRCGCHIAACGAPRAADSAFPRPRLGARSRRAVPARPPPSLAHPHLHRPPPPRARRSALTTSEADLAAPGNGPGAALAPPSRVPRANTAAGPLPGLCPPPPPPPPATAHSPSAAPTTKASSVPMAALRALRPPPGPPVLIAGQEAAGPGGG